ncbi:MAG: multidrug effflux MFS transporter [Geminicoccaceae bacterium]|nr:multidrug effflux MFS transporter [Geminicoccaceae bacterium]
MNEKRAGRSPGPREFIALFALITSLTALTIDTMLPALAAIGRDFGVEDPRDTQMIVSIMVLGMMVGELFFGSLADALGRKNAIMIGLAIYAAGTLMTLFSGSMEILLAGRFVQGIGVSGPKIASRAILRDRFEGDALARIGSFIFMIFILVPMAAPAIGTILIIFWHWRSIFLLFLILAATCALWLGIRQPETLPPERRIPLSLHVQAGNLLQILRLPDVVAQAVALGFIFGAMLSFISMAPTLFLELYGIEEMFAAWFALLAFGIGIASFINGHVVRRFGAATLVWVSLSAAVAISAIGLVFVIGSGGQLPFSGFVGLFFCLFLCIGSLFGNITALAMQPLGRIAGMGASFVSALSSLVSGLFAMASGRFYDGTLLPVTTAMLLALTIAALLFAFARRRVRRRDAVSG